MIRNDHANKLTSQIEKYEKNIEGLSNAFTEIEKTLGQREEELEQARRRIAELELANANPVETKDPANNWQAESSKIHELIKKIQDLDRKLADNSEQIEALQKDNDDLLAMIGEMESEKSEENH